MHLSVILRITGILVSSFSLSLILPMIVAMIYYEDTLETFTTAFAITMSVGLLLTLAGREKHELRSGDVVELGQVMLRYVAPDEHYLYDPADAAQYLPRGGGLSRNNLLLAAGILGIAIVAAAFILSSGEEPPAD